MSGTCGDCGLEKKIRSRGLCSACYTRLLRSGNPLPPLVRLDDPQRFWANVDRTAGCWEWMAYRSRDGYGKTHWGSTNTNAHRVAYELVVGPIPSGLVLDHLCRNRGCVNPAHLDPVTQAENVRRGEPASRTHCPSGHEYTAANTKNYRGRRHCRTCHTTHQANYVARRKAS